MYSLSKQVRWSPRGLPAGTLRFHERRGSISGMQKRVSEGSLPYRRRRTGRRRAGSPTGRRCRQNAGRRGDGMGRVFLSRRDRGGLRQYLRRLAWIGRVAIHPERPCRGAATAPFLECVLVRDRRRRERLRRRLDHHARSRPWRCRGSRLRGHRRVLRPAPPGRCRGARPAGAGAAPTSKRSAPATKTAWAGSCTG